jgi:hypothetical protein
MFYYFLDSHRANCTLWLQPSAPPSLITLPSYFIFATESSYGDSDLVGGHFFQPPEGIRVFSQEENQSCCAERSVSRALVPTFLAFVG